MNPKKFDESEDGSRKIINGPRPTFLTINKESHAIRKPSNASTSQLPKQEHGPVIIYTESPKIIHTEARDFMALVQKLTGRLSEKKDDQIDMDKKKSSSPIYKLSNPYLADFPLFTPNSTNLFCSPQTNMSSSISPSFMDLLKRISEY
ncbi:hypothetical protein RND71_039559 [Anisodus tanguticus]|uniref:VQ domain-containing protein n=1 Tax=Anisodus tanguticus TaxID=243964 RepID=A0AAE1QXM2_9SOLA|nr:hypothetical protein RND71_039559 [Anisodus tanguticus]